MSTSNTTIEELLASQNWLTRLARSLTVEPDDAVQETLATALAKPPTDHSRPLRPWLTAVLRNVVRMTSRGESRRGRREEASVADDDPPSPETAILRVETQRNLAALVLALDPLYRDVILLRYYEGLSSVAIAKRMGVPGATIRWRLREGLQRLRRQLEDREPDRWKLALMPLVAGRSQRTVTSLIATPLLIVVAVTTMVMFLVGKNNPFVGSGPPAPPQSSAGTPVSPKGTSRRSPAQVPVGNQSIQSRGVLIGRILEFGRDRGVAHASVTFICDGAAESVDTIDDGSFRFETERTGVCDLVEVATAGFAPLEFDPAEAQVRFLPRPGKEISGATLFLQRLQPMIGKVIDTAGKPAARARIRVEIGMRPEAAFFADEHGRFNFQVPTMGSGFVVEAQLNGARTTLVGSEQDADRKKISIQLPASGVAATGSVEGVVLDENGTPLADATVWLRKEASKMPRLGYGDTSNADGRFRIADIPVEPWTMVVRAPGREPAVLREVRPGSTNVIVQMRRGIAIHGSVTNSVGAPLQSFTVRVVAEQPERRAINGVFQKTFYDVDGQFALEGISAGVYAITVSGQGFTDHVEHNVAIERDQDRGTIVVTPDRLSR